MAHHMLQPAIAQLRPPHRAGIPGGNPSPIKSCRSATNRHSQRSTLFTRCTAAPRASANHNSVLFNSATSAKLAPQRRKTLSTSPKSLPFLKPNFIAGLHTTERARKTNHRSMHNRDSAGTIHPKALPVDLASTTAMNAIERLRSLAPAVTHRWALPVGGIESFARSKIFLPVVHIRSFILLLMAHDACPSLSGVLQRHRENCLYSPRAHHGRTMRPALYSGEALRDWHTAGARR